MYKCTALLTSFLIICKNRRLSCACSFSQSYLMQAICCTDNQKFDFQNSSHAAKELLGEKRSCKIFSTSNYKIMFFINDLTVLKNRLDRTCERLLQFSCGLLSFFELIVRHAGDLCPLLWRSLNSVDSISREREVWQCYNTVP